MRPEQLAEHYPKLYHMAWAGSWRNIEKHGLLSTKALLDVYGVKGDSRENILARHRPNWIKIKTSGLPNAVIRDQKPMSDEGVERALGGGNPEEWYRLLNSMVFFWPTKERLKVMMSARAYHGMKHDVLVIDTAKLVDAHEGAIRISPMNSGATKPFPHPRTLGLFKTISDFPFDERMKSHRVEKAVAEICVLDGVTNIKDFILGVRSIFVDEIEII